jgi:hypothetical protein
MAGLGNIYCTYYNSSRIYLLSYEKTGEGFLIRFNYQNEKALCSLDTGLFW